MRQIRELLRLHHEEGLSRRVLARSQGVARSTVERLLKHFAASGLSWPLDAGLSDEELERRLYRSHPHHGTAKPCARPNYAAMVPELARLMVDADMKHDSAGRRSDGGAGHGG